MTAPGDGWAESAAAWVASMGEDGDFGRLHVLDRPMLARIAGRGFRTALDVGCGEGRFCRKLVDLGITTVGIDPTPALVATARARHAGGDYLFAAAEALPFADASFDLVIAYLSLIDIPDLPQAIGEMARVMAPGATLLIANVAGFQSVKSAPPGKTYLDEFATWEAWQGIRVRNWHRPLSRYMALLLGVGLTLRHFDEPPPTGGDPEKAERYRQQCYFFMMEWQKPA